jgi:hypothetical protein
MTNTECFPPLCFVKMLFLDDGESDLPQGSRLYFLNDKKEGMQESVGSRDRILPGSQLWQVQPNVQHHANDTSLNRVLPLQHTGQPGETYTSLDRMQPGGQESLMQGIFQPHDNDVLMGRGGKNNQAPGNMRLRNVARFYCQQYRISKKKEKSEISRHLVSMVRNLAPPGR